MSFGSFGSGVLATSLAMDGALEERRSAASAGRRWCLAALGFFLLVKLAWVLLPPLVMGMPRLGDDSLVYLWSGASSVAQPRLDAPAIQDIIRLRREQADPPPALEHARARVTMRTTGVTASPLALLGDGFLRAGAGQKFAFALTEAVVALALGVGIAYCAAQLAGPGAAAATLAVIALAILPVQGLHYLVPSVFVLSLGLVLWTVVLKQPARWRLVLGLAVIMLLTHPIGPVYVLVAAALLAGAALLARGVDRQRLYCLAALVAAVPLWLALNALLGVRVPATGGLGGLSFSAIPANVAGLLANVGVLASSQPVLGVLAVLGLARAAWRPRQDPDAFVLAGVLLGVVVTTVVVDLPGYPGELASRALIALIIVCTAVASGWLLELGRRRRWPTALAVAAVIAVWCMQVPQLLDLGWRNVNGRHLVYDAAVLRDEIQALPPGAVVIWVDSDSALMAGLLEGADRVHAVPYSMLANPAAVRQATAGAQHIYVVSSAPQRLNGVAITGSRSVQPRFYGYGFDLYRRISLQAGEGASLPGFLRLEGGDASALRVTREDGRGCTVRTAPAAAAGWVALEGCGQQGMLHLESSSPALRLTGLSRQQPDPARPWPWDHAGPRLKAEPAAGGPAIEVAFSYADLLGAETADAIESELGPFALASARSGLVWLRATGPASKP